jgi:hypothetical protein
MLGPVEQYSDSEEAMEKFDENMQTLDRISLTKLFDDCLSTDPLASYQADIRDWVTTYLTAPHPELGRVGPVCPRTAPSISKELFWVGCVDRPDLTADDIERTVAGMVTEFHRLPPTEGSDALLKAILILFPTVTGYEMIDEAQRRLKNEFVAMGLMIGQFYPGCGQPGIRNPQFRPLQSPFALLAIRHMVSSDFPFLIGKAQWVEEYLKTFAPAIPASVRSIIAAKFDVQSIQAP